MSLNSVTTEILVDGQPCDYIYMHLDQRMCGHHTFEIAASYRHQKKSVWPIQTTKDIHIKATELIQLEAKKIVMLAQDVQVQAENNIEMVADKTVHLESSDMLEIMSKDIMEESSNEFSQKGKDIIIKADSSMNVDGGQKLDVGAVSIKMNK